MMQIYTLVMVPDHLAFTVIPEPIEIYFPNIFTMKPPFYLNNLYKLGS
jgi:hypothetical protein